MSEIVDLLFSQARVPIAWVDDAGRLVRANRLLEDLSGIAGDRLIARAPLPPFSWLVKDGRDSKGLTLQEIPARSRGAGNREGAASLDPIAPDQRTSYPYQAQEIPIPPHGTLVFFFERTDPRELIQADLHTARLASLGKVLSGIIHEMSNPLAVISGCAQLLCAQNLPAEVRETVERMAQEARRTADLVKNVLSFARKEKDVRERFDVGEAVEEAAVLKKYSLKSDKIRIEMEQAGRGTLPVVGFKVQLIQVLLNLLNNAEQAVRESAGGGGRIGLQSRREGERAVIRVWDTGPGIPPHCLDRIFEAFFTTKKEAGGTGLGLHLARTIVRSHGGDLFLAQNGPSRTAFDVSLPLCAADKGALPGSDAGLQAGLA